MRWRSAIDRAITPLGLTNAQYSVLAPLLGMERSGQRPSQRQLADFTGLEPLYVSKLARALEQAGLIERSGHPDDSRAVQLSLTDQGREVTAQATERVRGLQDELTAPLGGLDSPATRNLIDVAAHPARIHPSAHADRSRPMTHSAALQGPALNGQDIGQAEHATRAVLDRLLARTGIQFHGWVIINQLAASGGALGEEELTGRITHGLKIGEDAVHAAAAELAWQGLISREPAAGGGTQVALTPAGTARFEQIQGGIGQVTQRLYGGLPESDLAIAHRVLATVTERANAELADADPASA